MEPKMYTVFTNLTHRCTIYGEFDLKTEYRFNRVWSLLEYGDLVFDNTETMYLAVL